MRVVVVCYFSSFFLVSTCIRSFTGPCFFPHANYPRTADQNVTPVTKAHSTAEHNRQLALHTQLLALSNSCLHQIMGLLLSVPYTCFLLHSSLPCASVAGGVSRPRSGALVYPIKYLLAESARLVLPWHLRAPSAEIWAWLISSAPPSTPPQRYSSQQRSAVQCPAMLCSSSLAERSAVL